MAGHLAAPVLRLPEATSGMCLRLWLPYRHLDADEAVVLGAGLFAANLSTIFRLRKFGMTDKVPYSVSFRMGGDEAGKCARKLVGGPVGACVPASWQQVACLRLSG